MKNKTIILVFPINVERKDVETLNGNVYSREELFDLLDGYYNQMGIVVETFDLENFIMAVNEGVLDVLTESWLAVVNVVEE